jgi:hypothetical protein
MSGENGARRGLDEALATRRRASVVSGLRGLARPGPVRPPGPPPTPGVETQGGSIASATLGPSAPEDAEYCDLCGLLIGPEHRHLLHLTERRIVCACEACWAMRSGEGDFRPTGNRTLWLQDVNIPDDLWASFQIPIGLAFFMHSTVTNCVVAMYPSPAGATESELRLDAWQRMLELNPVLHGMEHDIEGLIANRIAEPPAYLIAPIDECYALTGTIKAAWEGISGGAAVEAAVTGFFQRLEAKATR